jgi:hypothetical protein
MPHTPAKRTEQVIRSKLADYLTKRMSLRAFWRWFVPAVWDIDHNSPARLRELVYEIKRHVDDYSSGHISENHLRYELLSLVSSVILMEGTSEEDSIHRRGSRPVAGTAPPTFKLFSRRGKVLKASYKKYEVAFA